MERERFVLLEGDCLETLKTVADASVDSVVTDPPYEIGFMGEAWDGSGIAYNVQLWRECLRVLKPGGHLLAFGATRSYHRMAVAIEDAGFEVRDSIHWTYGSGFPKSLNVGKAIDKQKHTRAEVYLVTAWIRGARDAAGLGNKDIDAAFGFAGMAGHWTSATSQPSVPTLEQVPVLLNLFGLTPDDVPDDVRRTLIDLNTPKGQPGPNWFKREVVGTKKSSLGGTFFAAGERDPDFIAEHKDKDYDYDITAPATPEAKRWEGWSTALKPSHEPIVVARKPLAGTVAANVLEHGTGALNIDGCRVGSEVRHNPACRTPDGTPSLGSSPTATEGTTAAGRWPANTVLTHAAGCTDTCVPGCPVAALDTQNDGASRYFTQTTWDPQWDVPFKYVPKPSRKERNAGLGGLPEKRKVFNGKSDKPAGRAPGSVEDKFTTAPATNNHPTVKPVALMRYLVRLLTPPGGTVLDPFLGSGTTAVASILEGYNIIGCELTPDYYPIIEARVTHAQQTVDSALFPE